MRKPATMVGIFVGLLAGALSAAHDTAAARFPAVGIIIAVLMPAVTFIFEQLMREIYPEVYREKVAGMIYFSWRWLLNESFSVRFFCNLNFSDGYLPDVQEVCEAIGAGPGKNPRPTTMTKNTVHLQYQNVSDYFVIKWFPSEADDDAAQPDEACQTVFLVTLDPAVRQLSIRSAPEQLDALSSRISELRNLLVRLLGNPADELAVATAWLGNTEPPRTPPPPAKEDTVIRAKVRLGIGWVQVTGKGASVLSGTYRHVKVLEPPPAKGAATR